MTFCGGAEPTWNRDLPIGYPGILHGNLSRLHHKSHIYHQPDCPNYSQVASQNRVAFNSAAEAESAGYRRAGNCR